MIRTREYKLIINPADINELYDLRNAPLEMINVYADESLRDAQLRLTALLYHQLKASGDNFYHWTTSMYDTGDASLNQS